MSYDNEAAENGPDQEANEGFSLIEPTARWIRVEFNDQIIADTRGALLVRDGHRLTYYFPAEDVDGRWLELNREGRSGRRYYDVIVSGRRASSAAWTISAKNSSSRSLVGFFAFRWSKMDRWYEEEEEVFSHPRDPYHRLDAIKSSRHVQVVIDGETIAESQRPVLLFETGLPTRYYIPQEDVRMDLLSPSRTTTQCPYKGTASYWNLNVASQEYRNFVWGYLDPIPESQKIRGLVCFYNEKADIYVDGKLEEKPKTLWS